MKRLIATLLTLCNCLALLLYGMYVLVSVLSPQQTTCNGQSQTIQPDTGFAVIMGAAVLITIAATLLVYFRKPRYALLSSLVVAILSAGVFVLGYMLLAGHAFRGFCLAG